MFWIWVCLGLGLICVGIPMIVGIFVGEILGVVIRVLGESRVVQNLLKGLVLVGFWLVGRG